MGRLAAWIALLAMLALLAPRQGMAHAVLLETVPAADSVAAVAPERIVLRFNEPVRPTVLRVIDLEGTVLADTAAARAIDGRVELALPDALPRGGYIVTWRVVSADSHPVGGAFRFAVGAPPQGWQAEGGESLEPQDMRFWTVGLAAARSLFLAGLLLAAGGAWFRLLVTRGRGGGCASAGGIVRLAALVGAVAALAGIGLQGGLLMGARPAELMGTALWAAGLSVPLGQAMLASAVLLAALAALARRASPLPAGMLALLAVLPLAWAGHAAMAQPQWLTMPALALHVVVAGFWFGALPPLLHAVRRLPGGQAAALLARFSALAVPAVAALLVAGTVLAAVQMGSVSAFWSTAFGALLAGKIVLVAGLLLLALHNRNRLLPALAAGRQDAGSALARTIGVEIGLIALVLVLTALLGFNTPPRVLQPGAVQDVPEAPAAHGHHHGHHHGDQGPAPDGPGIERRATVRGTTLALRLSPGRAGTNRLHVVVEDADGAPLEVLEVQARFASGERGIEPVSRRLEPADGHFTLETADLALPGTWQVRIDVLVTEFDKPIFAFELAIP